MFFVVTHGMKLQCFADFSHVFFKWNIFLLFKLFDAGQFFKATLFVFQPGFHHPDTQKHKQLNLLFCLFFMCLNVLCFVCFQYFFLYSLWLNPTYLFGTKVSSKYILPCGRHIWFLRFALSSLLVDIMMCSIFFCVENIWWWVVWKCIDFVFTLVRE